MPESLSSFIAKPVPRPLSPHQVLEGRFWCPKPAQWEVAGPVRSHPLLPRSLRPDAGESFIEKLSIRGSLSWL